ncbi:MAG TPA: c-type cytochrome [Planktothrix sp.]|jgi:mono/diheme cytochrome c family protein
MKRLIDHSLCAFLVIAIASSVSLFGATLASADDKQVAAGKKIFEKLMCVNCHPGGENTLQPSKPLKGKKFNEKYKSDKALEDMIREGNPAEGMPSFGDRFVNPAEMKQLIAYIRTFSIPPKPAK